MLQVMQSVASFAKCKYGCHTNGCTERRHRVAKKHTCEARTSGKACGTCQTCDYQGSHLKQACYNRMHQAGFVGVVRDFKKITKIQGWQR